MGDLFFSKIFIKMTFITIYYYVKDIFKSTFYQYLIRLGLKYTQEKIFYEKYSQKPHYGKLDSPFFFTKILQKMTFCDIDCYLKDVNKQLFYHYLKRSELKYTQ